ncbi:MAG TPA: hypothetical protein ENI97_05270 [Gammaproteobacteria bacterium]|nr:hypothetical protein [Gammaproteobacteria bacterium]
MRVRINWFTLFIALLAGCLLNFLGDWLLGVRIELFWGLKTFNIFWFLQLFILPLLVGIAVSYIYGLGGKWIAVFPPLIVRYIAYYQTVYSNNPLPDGAELMPLGWWGFFVILAMESAMIGGVLGEIMNRRIYGWKKAAHVSDGDAAVDKQTSSLNADDKAGPGAQKS